MQIRFILIFLTFLPFSSSAQLEENFDIPGIEDLTVWAGDLDQFIINTDKQLQLDALEDGASIIYTPISYPEAVEWQFFFKLDFAPSNSNQLKVYLSADTKELSESSGYFLEVGESGANDKLKFYKQENGSKTLLGEGSMGALGDDPAVAMVKVVKAENGQWSFFAAYGDDPFVQIDFEHLDNSIDVGEGFFGFVCKYSESRKDKFFFDDIYVGKVREDLDPPMLVSASFIDPSQIRLVFDEIVSADFALDPLSYSIDNGLGNPAIVSFGDFDNEVILQISPNAVSGVEYNLAIQGVEDLSGNSLTTEKTLFLSSVPLRGDLIINEILFDPYPGTGDFVELYNISDKYLTLDGLVLQNLDNNKSVQLSTDFILKPSQYLAITSDVEALDKDYMILIPENIIEHSLPAWSNGDGNVSLTREGLAESIDSYDYSEDNHSVWIDDTEGVSLERIDPYVVTNLDSNWQSATEQSGFATPGYINSNFSELVIDRTEFILAKKTFSPDGDGFDDFLEVNYRVTEAGFVLNMRVFDDRGYLVKTLATNEILGKEGSVIWDGTSDDGSLGKMGIHVIWLEYFDTQGSIAHKKLSCVLAKQLN